MTRSCLNFAFPYPKQLPRGLCGSEIALRVEVVTRLTEEILCASLGAFLLDALQTHLNCSFQSPRYPVNEGDKEGVKRKGSKLLQSRRTKSWITRSGYVWECLLVFILGSQARKTHFRE